MGRNLKAHLRPASPVPVAARPEKLRRRHAFELLAAQPIALAGLLPAERDKLIVTAVADDHGNEHPMSRFGDASWNMGPEVDVKNKMAAMLSIVWPEDVPKALVDDAKAALYCALRRGRHEGRPWSGSAILKAGRDGLPTLRYLASLGVRDFSEVSPLHLSDYIADLRGKIKGGSARGRLDIVDLIRAFPNDVIHPLTRHPWGGQTLPNACGCNDEPGPSGRTGKTPVIPRAVQRALFAYCEARLDQADDMFRARDAGEIGAGSYYLTAIRDAILYMVQITSGMRNSESTAITSGCWRTEVKNGVTFHWVRTREVKTKQGDVDFLVPPEAIRALELLQRYAEPLQTRLADEARWLELQLRESAGEDGQLANGMTVPEAVHRLNHVREIGRHLFLSHTRRKTRRSKPDHLGDSRVEVMSVNLCNGQLKSLARAAGVEWELANHHCRRTFAYNVANSRLGRMGLVFLKWQLKHASLSWTQLYASSPYQDDGLYMDLREEMLEARVQLLEGWSQLDAPLSGGAGKRLMQTRTTPVQDLGQLLRLTAESVTLRSTGHAWCLSGTRPCHGQGVYDPAICGGCSQAVIDRDHATAWQIIHLENLRLATLTDCGPAVQQKARRAIDRSTQVLNDLGVALPTSDQAEAYERDGKLQ